LANFSTNTLTGDYVNLLLSNNFIPKITLPTRISTRSATLIDHIYHYQGSYKNSDKIKCLSGNLFADISDHLPNWIIIQSNDEIKTLVKDRPIIRLFTDKNKLNFRNCMANVDWSEVVDSGCNNIDSIYNSFIDKINVNFDNSFPKVRLSARGSKDKSWMTKGIRISSAHKNKLYKKYLLTKLVKDEIKYRKYKKVFAKTIKAREKEYYYEIFNNRNTKIKDM